MIVFIKKHFFFASAFVITLISSFGIFYSHYGKEAHRFPYHDTLFLQYPYKFFISSAIQAGTFPLWDHWTNAGTSLSSTLALLHFSPVVFILSLIGTYTYTTMLVEMLIFQFIGFLGMYLWIRLFSNKWVSIYVAFIFTSTPALLGTIGESGVLVTMNLIPIFAYSLKRTIEGSISYTGVLAIMLWVMFTSGYFGLNVMNMPIIGAYLLVLFALRGKKLRDIRKGLLFAVIAGFLFLGITNFSWIEAYVHTAFDYESSRTYAFNPFDGAAGVKTLFTLFFAHSFPSFVQQTAIVSAPGVTNMIYFGVINLLFVALSFLDKKNRKHVILLSVVMAIIFFLSLHSYNTFIERVITSIPFLSITRWHGWYNALFIFYGLTLSAFGINYLLKINFKKIAKKLIFSEAALLLLLIFFSLVLNLLSDSQSPSFGLLQILTVFLLLIATILMYKSKKSISKKSGIILTSGILALSVIEFVPNTLNALTFRDRWNPAYLEEQTVKEFSENTVEDFPVIENERRITVNHHITKVPTYESYNPFTDADILHLKRSLEKEKYAELLRYIFYFPDENLKPQEDTLKNIKITKFFPNEIVLEVNNAKKQTLIWSSAYSPNWKISINETESKIFETSYGFSQFELSEGLSTVQLHYEPDYLTYSFLVMFLSIALSITLSLMPLIKKIPTFKF